MRSRLHVLYLLAVFSGLMAAQAAAQDSASTISMNGIGAIRLGMNVGDAVRAVSLPFSRYREQQGQPCYYLDAPIANGFLSLLVVKGRVESIAVSGTQWAKTEEGVRLGDPVETLKDVYRARLIDYQNQDPDSADVYGVKASIASRDRRALFFYVGNDRIWQIHAAKLPDAEYLRWGGEEQGCWEYDRRADPTWRLATRIVVAKGEAPDGLVELSGDGRYVVRADSGERQPAGSRDEGHVAVIDARTGKIVQRWRPHRSKITAIAVASQENLLGTSADDGSVVVSRFTDGAQIADWYNPSRAVSALTFNYAGDLLAEADTGQVTVRDLRTSGVLGKVKGTVAFGSISLSPDGRLLALGHRVVEVRSALTAATAAAEGLSACSAFSPNGKLFALCQWDRIEIRETDRWTVVHSFARNSRHQPFHSVGFDPTGRYLITVLWNRAWTFDIETGAVNSIDFAGVGGDSTRVALAPDGSLVSLSAYEVKGNAPERSVELRRWVLVRSRQR